MKSWVLSSRLSSYIPFILLVSFIGFSLPGLADKIEQQSILWVSDSSGLVSIDSQSGTVLLRIPDLEHQAVIEVDRRSGSVLALQGDRLQMISSQGDALLDITVSGIGNELATSVAFDVSGTSFWVAAGRRLLQVDLSGDVLKSVEFASPIVDLIYNDASNQVWMIVDRQLHVIEASGSRSTRFDNSATNISGIAYDASSGQVWLDSGNDVQRVDRYGNLMFNKSQLGSAGRVLMQADLAGGIWRSDGASLLSLDSNGEIKQQLKPFAGFANIEILDLVVDPQDGSVWLSNGSTLLHINLLGKRLQQISPGDGDSGADVNLSISAIGLGPKYHVLAGTGTTDDLVRGGTDADGDGVPDIIDNCSGLANPNQVDADNDGYGNRCDADFDNSGFVNFLDLSLFANAFLSNNAVIDINSDGTVNFLDLVHFSNLFLQPPGPGPLGTPLAPTLDAFVSPTSENPVTITGQGTPAGMGIRIYSGGEVVSETIVASDGTFSVDVVLLDGINNLTATAWNGLTESTASNILAVDFFSQISIVQNGVITEDTVWTLDDGNPYIVTADLTVAAGACLIITRGATVLFTSTTTDLFIDGCLRVLGTDAQPVNFTTANTPALGSWPGIKVRATANEVFIDHAIIEWTVDAVNVVGADVIIQNSTLRNFSSDGIYLSGVSGGLIAGNTIDNISRTRTCMYLINSTVPIQNNSLLNCTYGAWITGSSNPPLLGNTIMGNTYGLYLDGTHVAGGNPEPVINGNSFEGNTSFHLYSNDYNLPLEVTINATNNWWGTTTISEIATEIRDYSDDILESPIVDFSGFLDADGGVPSTQDILFGPIDASTIITAGSDLVIAGRIDILAGTNLTIEAGSQIRTASTLARIQVAGNLVVAGTDVDPVVLTSEAGTRGSWVGIVLNTAGATAAIDHAVIEWAVDAISTTGQDITVTNSTIREFSSDGIYMNGVTGGLIDGNVIDNINRAGTCINLLHSSPVITDNSLSRCAYGVYASGTSNPNINGNDIDGNTYGVYLDGTHIAGQNPLPLVNNNNFVANTSFHMYSNDYDLPLGVVIDATNNWWNTTVIAEIATEIRDYTDDPAEAPTIDFSGFLDGPGGVPSTASLLFGPIQVDTTVPAGTDTFVPSRLIVLPGATLTLDAGTSLRFAGTGAQLIVDGGLVVNGTELEPVLLTSEAGTRGSWTGIVLTAAGSTATIDHAVIEWAIDGISSNGQNISVTNSTIREFSSDGIYLTGVSGGLIDGNTIDNTNRTGTCINLLNSSPTISNNTLQNCTYGAYISAASNPVVTGNDLFGNTYGLWLDGTHIAGQNPAPLINNNSFVGNTSFHLYSNDYDMPVGVIVDATNNWWGTISIAEIANEIRDYTEDALEAPTVDFSGFLDAPNGVPSTTPLLLGQIAVDTTITGGTNTFVPGRLDVLPGATLTIEAGTTLTFAGTGARIAVDGGLIVNGTALEPVLFTSEAGTRGSWTGIVLATAGATADIDYAVIEWAIDAVSSTGQDISVTNSTIREFSSDGIYLSGVSGGLIDGNTIDNTNRVGACINLLHSSPAITNNVLKRCNYGAYVSGSSNPNMTGNDLEGNTYGVWLDGTHIAGQNPAPLINNNSFVGNTSFHLYSNDYDMPVGVFVDATNNWWGTISVTEIANKIRDYTEDTLEAPTIDFSGFLDGPGGVPSTVSLLLGQIAVNTTIASGTNTIVPGRLDVLPGATLTVESGTTLNFAGTGARITVDGALIVNGTALEPVLFTSEAATRGSWTGIVLATAGAMADIDYAVIEWAVDGISSTGQNINVTNSTIREFSSDGIYFSGVSGGLIDGNTIDNTNRAGSCINLLNSSPAITNNVLQRCSNGVYVSGASNPNINSNEIEANNYGVWLDGAHVAGQNPAPLINSNSFVGNTSFHMYSNDYDLPLGVVVDATNNWWGTVELATIALKIRDYTEDALEAPHVDYSSPLDSPGGSPVPGNYLLLGHVTTNTTVPSGVHEIIGSTVIANGASLTVQAGAELHFVNAARFEVHGALQVNGTQSDPVTFTSGHLPQARSNWQGIKVFSDAQNVSLSYATVEWMTDGIRTDGGVISVDHSVFREFSSSGVYVQNVASSSISNSLFDNSNLVGTGIYIWDASPTVTANSIHRNDFGMYIRGLSSPVISGNAISANRYGIYLLGVSNSVDNPTPAINNNDLLNNTVADLYIRTYGTASTLIIDATSNYWGAAPQAGQQIVFSSSATTTADFTGFAGAPITGSFAVTSGVNEFYFSPNSDGVKDVTMFDALLSNSASWTLNIENNLGGLVRSFSGAGTLVSQAWDGADGGGSPQPDGIYRFTLTVPGVRGDILSAKTVVLDNTLPQANITNPINSIVVQNALSLPVTGSADDIYLVNFNVEYGVGAVPVEWISLTGAQTTGVQFGQLATWVVGSVDGSVSFANGDYSLRVTSSDLAGNQSVHIIVVTLDTLSIFNVTQNTNTIRPSDGEVAQIMYEVNSAADVTMRIYDDVNDQLIYQAVENIAAPGMFTFVWDGRDSGGQLVPEEAYYFALEGVSGPKMATYEQPNPVGVGSGSGSVDPNYNAHRNDYWQMTYNLSTMGRVSMQVTPSGAATFFPMYREPFEPGSYPLVWDGRDPDGNIVSGTVNFYFEAPVRLRSNSIIIKGLTPGISGGGATPTVIVQSDPFRVAHSYDNVSTIVYRLDRDAIVTVKLLPPGVDDFNSMEAITITSTQLQMATNGVNPVDHVLNWNGYDASNLNDVLTTSQTGTYTFAIQAVDPVTLASSLYRGSLQIRR